MKTQILCDTGKMMDERLQTQAISLKLTFTDANEEWRRSAGQVSGCSADLAPEGGAASGEAGARQHPNCKIGQRNLSLPHTLLYPVSASSSLALIPKHNNTLWFVFSLFIAP